MCCLAVFCWCWALLMFRRGVRYVVSSRLVMSVVRSSSASARACRFDSAMQPEQQLQSPPSLAFAGKLSKLLDQLSKSSASLKTAPANKPANVHSQPFNGFDTKCSYSRDLMQRKAFYTRVPRCPSSSTYFTHPPPPPPVQLPLIRSAAPLYIHNHTLPTTSRPPPRPP